MAKKLKIICACGSGIATGTVAAEAIKTICKEEGIDAEVITTNTYNLKNYDNNDTVDILCSTSKVNEANFKKPIIVVFGLISGIGEDKIRSRLVEVCKAAQSEK